MTAEEKLRFADALLAAETENTPDGVLLADRDGRVVTYNRRFAEIWAAPPEALDRARVDDVFCLLLDSTREPAHRSMALPLFSPQTETQGAALELLDGRVVEVHSGAIRGAGGELFGRIWFFRDVTAQRRSEGALRASHALLATTERMAHIGGWRWEVEGDALAWSEEIYRIFGFDPRQPATVGAFLGAVHPGDRQRVEAAIDASLAGLAPYDVEFRVVRPDGVERIVHAQAEVEFDAAGQAVRMTGTSHDITEQRSREAALEFASALSTAQIESSPDGILVVRDRKIVSYNRKFVELWKIPSKVVRSRSDEQAVASVLHSLKNPRAFLTRLEELYTRPEERSLEELELTDGRVFERYTGPLPIGHGQPPGRIFFFRDITARRKAEEHIARMARQDGLTGLANRAVFVETVKAAIARTRREGNSFALLCLDLDHFKDINDTLGHPAGDLLLKGVADRLRSCIRETDLVARFGGDEFAIIQSSVGDPADVVTLAERVQSAMREPFGVAGNDVRIGVSIGITVHRAPSDGPEELLSRTDLALYRAKADGRGTYRFFAEGMDAEVRTRMALANDLRAGLDADEIFVMYQPQLEAATGRVIGMEALARWRHPRRGLVSPGEFIPVAEKSGLIVPVGQRVLQLACRQAKRWIDAGVGPTVVAVNVSGSQFRTPAELENTLAPILAETRLPRECLELELTESVLMEAWSEQRDVLSKLRASGIKIAIDDFGTGFSSLQYLARFPVDRIKIAQSFVAALLTDPRNAAIVRATLGLARELGLRVVAEGVETAAQFELLKEWGCHEIQGYYFERPRMAEDLAEVLARGTIVPKAPYAPSAQAAAATKAA